MKVGTDITAMAPSAFQAHVRLCARALAFAHGRSGSASAIAGYVGRGTSFARAIATWATVYADRTVEDHAALVAAAEERRIPLPNGGRSGAGDE
jgi:predicted alpha/beta hydrolase